MTFFINRMTLLVLMDTWKFFNVFVIFSNNGQWDGNVEVLLKKSACQFLFSFWHKIVGTSYFADFKFPNNSLYICTENRKMKQNKETSPWNTEAQTGKEIYFFLFVLKRTKMRSYLVISRPRHSNSLCICRS